MKELMKPYTRLEDPSTGKMKLLHSVSVDLRTHYLGHPTDEGVVSRSDVCGTGEDFNLRVFEIKIYKVGSAGPPPYSGDGIIEYTPKNESGVTLITNEATGGGGGGGKSTHHYVDAD